MKYDLSDQVKVVSASFSDGREMPGGTLHMNEVGYISQVECNRFDYMVTFPDQSREPFMEKDLELVK